MNINLADAGSDMPPGFILLTQADGFCLHSWEALINWGLEWREIQLTIH